MRELDIIAQTLELLGEDQLATSVDNLAALSSMKSPKELMRWMHKHIRYANFSKLLSPEEVVRAGRADCHSQALLQKTVLDQMGVKNARLFFIEYTLESSSGGQTHTLSYTTSGGIYWLENAWGDQMGMHGPFGSLSALKERITAIHAKGPTVKQFPHLLFAPCKIVTPGISLNTYVQTCLR